MGLIQIKSAQSKNRNLQRLDEIRLLVPPTNFISAKLLKLFYTEFLKKLLVSRLKILTCLTSYGKSLLI